MKAAVRQEIKTTLKLLEQAYIDAESRKLFSRVVELSEFQQASVVAAYLSMPSEANTRSALVTSFTQAKRIFIPKVIGKNPADLVMMELPNLDTIESFPLSKWGIPEPTKDMVSNAPDGTYSGLIDLVLVPGVAFDRTGGRIGHGKGYYDCFIDRLCVENSKQGKPAPTLVGIALEEQIVESCPLEEHDKILDYVVTPSETIICNQH